MPKSNPFPRLKPILKYVPRRLENIAASMPHKNWDSAYRWEHTLRVCHYGAQIAQAENCDVELAMAGCLLHDIARFDAGNPVDHGRLGAKIIKPLLQDWGFSKSETKDICYTVASHVDVKNPKTLLAKIVTDADNIDRFSALRILHFARPHLDDYSKLIEISKRRLEKLESYKGKQIMETKAGQKLFKAQIKRMKKFLRDLTAEEALTTFPPPSLKSIKD